MDYLPPVLTPPEIEPFVIVKPAEPTPPEPKLYVIVYGDNLTRIAETQGTTVDRLWAANPNLSNPDLITPETQLKIPLETDELAPRPYPAIIEPVADYTTATHSPPRGGYSSSGNTYSGGSCVWGVKQWKPEVSNSWGNANKWRDRARADGWTISSTPVVGAVAWTGRGSHGHVALVVAVSGDTVTIKEMNYRWVAYEVRTRVAKPGEFTYIYS